MKMEPTAAPEKFGKGLLEVTATCTIIIAIIGTLGNLLTAVTLLQNVNFRKNPFIVFMVNMPVCLLPVCVIQMPVVCASCFQLRRNGEITFPEWMIFTVFVGGLFLSQVHLHTTCALAFSRMLAVVWPAVYKRVIGPRAVWLVMAGLWLYSSLLWLPLTFGLFGHLEFVKEEVAVSVKDSTKLKMWKGLHVFFTFVLPVLFTSFCYVAMYIKVRQRRQIRLGSEKKWPVVRDSALHHWSDQVTRTILVIFAMNIFCNLPHIVVHILHMYGCHPSAWFLVHLVFWLHLCLDPVVYLVMSEQFRATCRENMSKLLRGFGFSRGPKAFPTADSSSNPSSFPISDVRVSLGPTGC